MRWSKIKRFACLLALFTSGACAEPFVGVDMPANGRLYYPGRMTVDGNTVYIVNTNFDQQFTTGWISQLDVPTLASAIASAEDPNVALDPNKNLKVPLLGGPLVLDPDRNRAYLFSHGSGLMTTVEMPAGGPINCGDPNNKAHLINKLRRTDCDNDHMLDLTLTRPPNVESSAFLSYMYADPIAAAITPSGPELEGKNDTQLAVGFLSQGLMLLMDPTQTPPQIQRAVYLGNTALLSLTAAGPGKFIAGNHVGQNTFDRGVVYYINASAAVSQNNDTDNVIPYRLSGDQGGVEISSLALEGNRLFLTSTSPDALVALQVNPNALGQYSQQTWTGATAVDSSHPTSVLYMSRPSGDLVAMTSLQQDSVYFFTPDGGRLQLVQRVQLTDRATCVIDPANLSDPTKQDVRGCGLGPYDVQQVKAQVNGETKTYLLVTTFFDHGLSIIDVTSPNFSQFEVVGRIHQGDLGVAPRFR